MKQRFSLDEFKKNPNRKVVTRDRKATARIICTDCKSEYPIIALLSYYENSEGCEAYTADGRFSIDGESNSDLFFEPEKKEGWVSVYRNVRGATFFSMPYSTKQEAIDALYDDTDTRIDTIKVEWEE